VKARLDHIGIAVRNLDEALAFYRDALGLAIEPPEEVASQRVRAYFVPVGESSLELLEATADDSAIARYVAKRGPGLHHITLRVDDLQEAMARLRGRGVRLIDETPREGAEGSLIAFVHPSAAHGVLVELKQAARSIDRLHTPLRHRLGRLELITLCDGFLRLDGGAMFGVVPRTMWERRSPPDDRNRVTLGMRPLIVRGKQTLMIDAGCGDKLDPKATDIYGLERSYHLDHALADAGLTVDDIDIVLASHLHFDHVGGFTARGPDGTLVPRFPKARYLVHRGEWEDATHPHDRNRASYLPENFKPLEQAGVLDLVEDDAEVMPGVRLRRSGGHTRHHQVAMIESEGEVGVFAADMLPTTAHVADAWSLGYDLYPMETLEFKRAFAREAIEREYLVFFEHDPAMAAGRLRNVEGKRIVERVL
jgi:methylmalonyl-CoA epimerase